MSTAHILLQTRLANLGLSAPQASSVEGIVRWLGAVQAQEEHHAKTAIGMRLPQVAHAEIERAIAEKRIVRTWMLRGTLHFVAVQDVWWMQSLVAKALIQKAAGTMLLGGLNEATLQRSNDVIAKTLPGAGPVLRSKLVAVLAAAGIDMKGPLSSRIFPHAAYSGLLCLGPIVGKQETFEWLEDVVPRPAPIGRETAIAALARRYFQSHGPATLDDFVSWSGLGVREARAGLQVHASAMAQFDLGGQTFFGWDSMHSPQTPQAQIRLLPGFDEYLIAYKDRSWILDPKHKSKVTTTNGIFRPIVLINNIVKGIWRRKNLPKSIVVELEWLEGRPKFEVAGMEGELKQLEALWGMPVAIDWGESLDRRSQ
jgi:hypothetical protein